MKKIKKYVAMLLGICMVIGSNGFSAIAADPTYIQENMNTLGLIRIKVNIPNIM